jgi:hypothetical protein
MTNSIQQNIHGPVWPLGVITVPTPGTPVSIMSLVDPSNDDAPESATSATSSEYTPRAYEIKFTACKPGAAHGLQLNTGNIYVVVKGVSPGTGNRDDQGSIVIVLPPGATTGPNFPTEKLTAAALNRNVFSPFAFSIDADNAGDGCLVVLNIE